jgi:hypothetical protein
MDDLMAQIAAKKAELDRLRPAVGDSATSSTFRISS